jgi:hypothetical protein
MSKLKHPVFAPVLPVRAGEIYNGNILRFSFINEDKWEEGIFGCYLQGSKNAQNYKLNFILSHYFAIFGTNL